MTRGNGRRALVLHLAVLLALLILQVFLPPFHHGMVARIMVLATYAIGYNLLLGYAGLMSLGHAMFFATGVYGAGLMVYHLDLGPAAAFLVGIAASTLVAAAVGLLTLRTTGVAFLIVTMMFAQVFYLSTLLFSRITGGDQGLVLTGHLQPLRLGGLKLALADPGVKYNVALATLAACLLVNLWLVRSPAGRVLVAIRENEERTRMLGYNTAAYRLLALIASGAIAGTAGAVYALLFSYVGSTFASILYSIYPLLWVLLGGAGTTVGPLIGAGLMAYIVDAASGLTSSYLLVVGLALVVLVMKFPAGLAGALRARWWRWLP
ncbi:MAG: branched-chain amino acid ABC transporter permease [Armatimonadota bacterium]|nr:branched-chain amino acid ABC transporter permease [Armatimonadota bacterium]MDR7548313.1 branched-chain amino acid ABC transporter permease [Armatimonadota bacterium]